MDEHGYGWKVTYNDDSTLEEYDGETQNKFSDIVLANVKEFWIKNSGETRLFKVNMTNGEFDIEGSTSTPAGVDAGGSFTLVWCRRQVPRTRIETRLTPNRCTYLYGYEQAGTKYLYSFKPVLQQVAESKGFM